MNAAFEKKEAAAPAPRKSASKAAPAPEKQKKEVKAKPAQKAAAGNKVAAK